MEEPLDSWFKREILPHEQIFMRFLARVWPRRHELPDIRQEAYARVYEAAQKARLDALEARLNAMSSQQAAAPLAVEISCNTVPPPMMLMIM